MDLLLSSSACHAEGQPVTFLAGGRAACGAQATACWRVNPGTGDVEPSLIIEGGMKELHDVKALPRAARPMVFGFKTDEIRSPICPTLLRPL